MNSMTGFGRAEKISKVGKFTVELSSVNNRFLEVSTRLPRPFFALEHKVKELVGKRVSRGKIHVFVKYEEPADAPGKYPINISAARAYYRQLKALKKDLKLAEEITLAHLLMLPEVGTPEQEGFNQDVIWPDLERVADKALTELIKMRKKEGLALARDLSERLKCLKKLTRNIAANAGDAVLEFRERLTERIAQAVDGPVADSNRLEEEIAIMAERADIAEECTRMLSHVSQFTSALKQPEAIGKRLNFILQEMNREANTIASKSSKIEVTRDAMSMKEEVEKMREQVQNIE